MGVSHVIVSFHRSSNLLLPIKIPALIVVVVVVVDEEEGAEEVVVEVEVVGVEGKEEGMVIVAMTMFNHFHIKPLISTISSNSRCLLVTR